MDGVTLDPQELDAIRGAMVQQTGTPARVGAADPPDARVIPLIADDRAAEHARPNGLKLAARWAELAPKRLQRLCSLGLELQVAGAEIIDGATLREQLAQSWVAGLEAAGRPGTALVCVSGPIIEFFAARLLGGSLPDAAMQRPPSMAALRVFTPVGDALTAALAETWHAEENCEVAVVRDEAKLEAWRRGFGPSEMAVVVTLAPQGAAGGQIRFIARPETLVVPPTPVEAVPAAPGAIEEALGAVPIEVQVELGRVRMTMTEFRALRPGSVITLDQFVDDMLPVRCAGVLKAFGRALVARGAMAVEIAGPVETGARSKKK